MDIYEIRERIRRDESLRESVRDLTQEVYLRLLEDNQQALRGFKGNSESSFLAYLAKIAANVVAEFFRKQLAEKRKGRTLSMELLLEEAAAYNSTSRAIIFTYLSNGSESEFITDIKVREFTDLLNRILSGPNCKRDALVFKLFLLEGLRPEQIASIAGFDLKVSSV